MFPDFLLFDATLENEKAAEGRTSAASCATTNVLHTVMAKFRLPARKEAMSRRRGQIVRAFCELRNPLNKKRMRSKPGRLPVVGNACGFFILFKPQYSRLQASLRANKRKRAPLRRPPESNAEKAEANGSPRCSSHHPARFSPPPARRGTQCARRNTSFHRALWGNPRGTSAAAQDACPARRYPHPRW